VPQPVPVVAAGAPAFLLARAPPGPPFLQGDDWLFSGRRAPGGALPRPGFHQTVTTNESTSAVPVPPQAQGAPPPAALARCLLVNRALLPFWLQNRIIGRRVLGGWRQFGPASLCVKLGRWALGPAFALVRPCCRLACGPAVSCPMRPLLLKAAWRKIRPSRAVRCRAKSCYAREQSFVFIGSRRTKAPPSPNKTPRAWRWRRRPRARRWPR